MCFFTMQYGFDPGYEREPTQAEVEELICITNQYMRVTMQDYLAKQFNETRRIQSFAVAIDWQYLANETPRIQITYSADASYDTPQHERIFKELVFQAFQLTEEQIKDYIMKWVWQVGRDSVFENVIRVNYNVKRMTPDTAPVSKLNEATCTETRAPTVAPFITPSPSMSPSVSQAPSVSMTPTVSMAPSMVATIAPNETESLVYFRMDVTLRGGYDTNATSMEDMNSLLCQTNTFFQEMIQQHLQRSDNSIKSVATNIEWVISASNQASSLLVYFTSHSTYRSSGELVPVNVVIAAVQDTNDELLKRIQTHPAAKSNRQGPSNIFQNSANDRPLASVIDDVSLEALPAGTPVRVGKLQVADCSHLHQDNSSTASPAVSPSSSLSSVPTVPPTTRNNQDNTLDTPPQGPTSGVIDDNNNRTNSDGSNSSNTNGADDNDGANHGGSSLVYPPPATIIDVTFLVSNLKFITEPDEVIHQGLDLAFPVFVKDLIQRLSVQSSTRRTLRRSLQDDKIELKTELDPGSAVVYSATQTACAPYAHPGLTCHDVKARYSLFRVNEDADDDDDAETRRVYEVETYKAINDGTFYGMLKREAPSTPLFLGTLPSLDGVDDSGDEDGDPKLSTTDWLMIVLLVLLGIICCWLLACVCHRYRVNRNEQHDIGNNKEKTQLKQDELEDQDNQSACHRTEHRQASERRSVEAGRHRHQDSWATSSRSFTQSREFGSERASFNEM
jgi:hypothetical protein